MSAMQAGNGPSSSEIAGAIAAVRQETLRRILGILAVACLLWQFVVPLFDTASMRTLQGLLQHWILFVIISSSLGGTYLLLQRRPALAGPALLASSTVTCTAALWLLQAPSVAFLYPLIVLAAAALVTSLSSSLVGVAGILALLALRTAGLVVCHRKSERWAAGGELACQALSSCGWAEVAAATSWAGTVVTG